MFLTFCYLIHLISPKLLLLLLSLLLLILLLHVLLLLIKSCHIYKKCGHDVCVFFDIGIYINIFVYLYYLIFKFLLHFRASIFCRSAHGKLADLRHARILLSFQIYENCLLRPIKMPRKDCNDATWWQTTTTLAAPLTLRSLDWECF